MSAAVAVPLDTAVWRPRFNPWLIALTVTLATFMEVLDTSIANIALPHIAGTFGASGNESTWVLTSYLVSNGIVLPISAWLATRLGRKRFYMSCVGLFAISSFLCGLAPSLGLLVFFRILQGAGGGGLQPSEQAILADTFRASETRHGVLNLWHGGGGCAGDRPDARRLDHRQLQLALDFLHQRSDQHSLALSDASPGGGPAIFASREGTPARSEDRLRRAGADRRWRLAACKWFWTRGKSWIGSVRTGSSLEFVVAVVVFVTWVIWEWRHPHPIVELKLLKNRNLATAVFFMFVLGFVLYGTTVLIPQFLQTADGLSGRGGRRGAGGRRIHHDAHDAALGHSGVARWTRRALMSFGFAATATALYYMATHLTLGIDFRTVAMLRVYQTVGLGVYFCSFERALLRGHSARK